jgi:hypothetical protein
MMTSLQRARKVLQLLLRAPTLGAAALIYTGLIYLSSTRADLLDFGNPWWVVTVTLVLLLSPAFHALVIGKTAAASAGRPYAIRDFPLESFGDLVAGELLVNAGVILGSALFLLPGIYLGIRSIFYKQSIVLHKARSVDAIRRSFTMTAEPRAMLHVLLFLAIAYSIPLAMDYWLDPVRNGLWVHPVAILVSTSFVAWVNVYITQLFIDQNARDAIDP